MLYIYSKNNITEIVCLKTTYKAQKPSLSVVKSLCERELFSYESRIKYTIRWFYLKRNLNGDRIAPFKNNTNPKNL